MKIKRFFLVATTELSTFVLLMIASRSYCYKGQMPYNFQRFCFIPEAKLECGRLKCKVLSHKTVLS